MLNKEEIEYIQANENAQTSDLLLHKSKNNLNKIDIQLCVKCIEARKKIKYKAYSWYLNPALVYPLLISVEQSSSQVTALFKQQLIKKLFYNKSNIVTADLTGGMGIDSYFISKIATKHFYFEQNTKLFKATAYNFSQLGANNIITNNIDITLNFNSPLKQLCTENISLIYIDPARRDKTNSKIILLQDYQPNVIDLLPDIFSISNYLLIKVSPMADISLNLKLLPFTEKVYIIAVNNECKELLFLLNKNFNNKEPIISCVNIESSYKNLPIIKEENIFNFYISNEQTALQKLANSIGEYLYEPNKAILKGGAYKLVSKFYNIFKIAISTHLYTSDTFIKNFNGKIFKVLEVIPFNKKNLKVIANKYEFANIIARNFPLDTNELKKLLKIKDGGTVYIFALTLYNKSKVLIICNQV